MHRKVSQLESQTTFTKTIYAVGRDIYLNREMINEITFEWLIHKWIPTNVVTFLQIGTYVSVYLCDKYKG